MSKMVLIRCQASNKIGFGHLVRSRVLAKKLLELEYRTILVGPNKQYLCEDDKKIFVKCIERESWEDSNKEAQYHIDLAKEYNIKHLIMDDYRSDYEHQLLLRKASLKVLQQYDASKPQKFAAHIVVNGSPYEKRSFYEKDLYTQDIIMLHGPKYAIIRDIFFNKELQNIKKKNQILVSFGGGDDKGALLYVLNELKDLIPHEWNLVLVIGSYNPNIEKTNKWIQDNNQKNIEVLVNPNNMPEVIASSKLAVLSGGTTTFEAAFLGTTAILMPIAENQYNQAIGWQDLGAMIYLKPFKKVIEGDLRACLFKLLKDTNKIEQMSKIARKCVDGKGVERLLHHLLKTEDR